jgi:hypothetical protein
MPSCMGISKNKSTWNNLLDIFKMTLALYVTLRNISVVLSKILGFGMLKWIAFFLKFDFLGDILTPMSIPRK